MGRKNMAQDNQGGYYNYPPQDYSRGYQPTHVPTEPKKKSRKGLWIALIASCVAAFVLCGVGALVVMGQAADSIETSIEQGDLAKKADVTINSCELNVLKMAEIKFTVKNSKPEVQSYWIQFEIQNAEGIRLGEAHGILNDVQPNATAKDSAVGGQDLVPGFKCVLLSVS
jgi:hypothetical protein